MKPVKTTPGYLVTNTKCASQDHPVYPPQRMYGVTGMAPILPRAIPDSDEARP